MASHYLTPLFSPRSVAVIGASNKPEAIGGFVLQNLLQAGFRGKIYAVNPKYTEVQGQPCYASLADIPDQIDLVVIATPAASVPDLVEAAGQSWRARGGGDVRRLQRERGARQGA